MLAVMRTVTDIRITFVATPEQVMQVWSLKVTGCCDKFYGKRFGMYFHNSVLLRSII